MKEKRDETIILRLSKTEKNRIYEKMLSMGRASTNADRFSVHFSISARKAVSSQNGKTIILKMNLISSTCLSTLL